MIFRIVKYVVSDILHRRIALAYMLFLLLVSFGLFNFGGDPDKGLVSLLSVVLTIVPLMSLVFSTVHYYNSYEFIELLSSQPLKRDVILLGQYLGIASALGAAFLLGVGLPVAIYDFTATGLTLVGAGILLTLAFAALAFLGAVCTRDKARGVGVALLLWFFFTMVYDGLVLAVILLFQDYPLERATIAMTAINPIDLARVVVLLQMDVSALMGITGTVLKEFLGSAVGSASAILALLLWMVVPLALTVRIFRRKDL